MAMSKLIVACLLAILAGNALAQNFPSKPLTLICPCPRVTSMESHLQAFAKISTKYLGQLVIVENPRTADVLHGLATMATTGRPDGYTLSMLPMHVLRVAHMEKLNWDPVKDVTYVIGLAGYTYGVVVKADSPFNSLKDLIDYAKANPGSLRYGSPVHGATAHLAMAELDFKTGARLLRVSSGSIADAAKALIDGRILALAENAAAWGPYVDAGTIRLLVTFGEQRSRWNAPTARELGFDIVSYSPFGIVGPKGMDPKVTKLLHDAFNRALDDPEYDKLLRRLELVDWYKSSEDYADWAVDQFRFQRALLERTIGLGRN